MELGDQATVEGALLPAASSEHPSLAAGARLRADAAAGADRVGRRGVDEGRRRHLAEVARGGARRRPGDGGAGRGDGAALAAGAGEGRAAAHRGGAGAGAAGPAEVLGVGDLAIGIAPEELRMRLLRSCKNAIIVHRADDLALEAGEVVAGRVVGRSSGPQARVGLRPRGPRDLRVAVADADGLVGRLPR
eukprot:CAMPEP_0176263494 /NCGR_PEP_ID=MMETSP0121_2-20121125/41153_1 /TAXON_ID=160619 /ORGANISM="Kryptoperidinium foliaceum, Strain CCMP 1326" /LENGTH=189 /DNA_ID=CAMNT_0017603489 /DNA_START=60 /DNA_END=625 /DNA_ORIENTATION=+